MAWALKDGNNSAVAVSLVKDHLQPSHNHTLVEIGEDLAVKVLNGDMPLSSLFAPSVAAGPSVSGPPRYKRGEFTSRYPALLSEPDVDALAHLSASMPEKSTVVEIGSRLGGSAKVILEHGRSIKRMYCIDMEWMLSTSIAIDDPNLSTIIDKWNIDRTSTCYAFAQEYLKPHSCVRLLPKSSPYDITWWSEPVDFVFEDSSHSNPQFSDNIWFWWRHLRSGGIMAGHDYGSRFFPDVTSGANAFAEAVGAPLNVASYIWWVVKP